MNDLVSIIVPIYKVEPYLRRCLDSIVNQTYTNLEIILVDDGSPDGCPQICDEYAAKDKRIIVIHKENGGLSDARNAGLDICNGEYISFVDSDDWVEKDYIYTLYSLLSNNNIDIAVGNFQQFSEDNQLFPPEMLPEGIFSNKKILDEILTRKTPYKLAWGKLFKKKLFDTIRFPVGQIHEDELVGYQPYCFSNYTSCTKKVLYHYLRRSDSIMGSETFYDITKIMEYQAIFFQKNGFNEYALDLTQNLSWEWLNRYWLTSTNKTNLFTQDICIEKINIFSTLLREIPHKPQLGIFLFSFFSNHLQLYLFYKKIFSCLFRNKRIVNYIKQIES